MDQELDDFASAMTNAWARDGQNEPSDNLPMGGNRFTNVGAAASAEDYLRAREFIEQVPIYMVEPERSGNNNALSVSADFFTTTSANIDPADGTRILVRVNATANVGVSAGGVILRLNTPIGQNSANVYDQDGFEVYKGQLRANAIHEFIWNSAMGGWQAMGLSPTTMNVTGTYRARNVSGLLAGEAQDVLLQVMRHGGRYIVGSTNVASVSCSISARTVDLSVFPAAWNVTSLNLHSDTQHTVLIGSSVEPLLVRVEASGSVVFDTANNPFGAIISADDVVKIPPYTLTFLASA